MDWSRNWFVHFNAGKAQLVLFDWSIDVKMEGSVLEEKSSLNMLRLTFQLIVLLSIKIVFCISARIF